MLKFLAYITEAAQGKLTHITHAEDRPLMHGADGFDHAHAALSHVHEHMKAQRSSSDLTMKYDGSPAVVFGYHPKTGKFFVGTKSTFSNTPKINYTHEDIERNHGDKGKGLTDKLHAALEHLPKVAPKKGVYQGDIMHSGDVKSSRGRTSFTPNTISYTARGETADRIKKSKFGIVVHTRYHGNDLASATAHHHVEAGVFKKHDDVYLHTAEHDTSKTNYPKEAQREVEHHLTKAAAVHKKGGSSMYDAVSKHSGPAGHLATYINQTVRRDETPSSEGFKKHLHKHFKKEATKVTTPTGRQRKAITAQSHIDHVTKNQKHYDNIFALHGHLQQAKNTLVRHLETHEGGYEHHIGKNRSKPEGFVINHEHGGSVQPTKLVNRGEFAKQNLLKVH